LSDRSGGLGEPCGTGVSRRVSRTTYPRPARPQGAARYRARGAVWREHGTPQRKPSSAPPRGFQRTAAIYSSAHASSC